MEQLFEDKTIAIKGYDPVSFFRGCARHGEHQYNYLHNNQTWLFANAENRDTFISNPVRYLPKFTGHCALAVSLGQKAPGKPTAWTIIDNELYFTGNALAGWMFKWIPGRKQAARKKWLVLQEK